MITAEQLKQIRFLAARADRDSLLIIEKNKEIDTLNTQLSLRGIMIDRLNAENDFNKQIILRKDSLILNEKNRIIHLEGLHKGDKKKIRNRTIIAIASVAVNVIFISASLSK